MNDDRLQQLLAAERAASTAVDDVAKDAAIVGHLRTIAGVGVVGALTASTAAQAATPAAGLATGSVAGFGLAKVVAVVVAASAAVSVVVLRPPATESVAARPQAASPPNPLSLKGEGEPSPPAAQRPALMTSAPAAVSTPPLPSGRGGRAVRQVAEPTPPTEVPATSDGPSSSPSSSSSSSSSLPAYDAAEAALRAGRFDDAANAFSWWLKDHPVDVLRPEAALSLIEALYRAHRYDELIAAAPAALVDVDVSRRGDVERLRAEAFVHLRRCDDAEVAFTKARRAHARDLDDDDVSAALSACRAASPR